MWISSNFYLALCVDKMADFASEMQIFIWRPAPIKWLFICFADKVCKFLSAPLACDNIADFLAKCKFMHGDKIKNDTLLSIISQFHKVN
jgi:hypothetical protein